MINRHFHFTFITYEINNFKHGHMHFDRPTKYSHIQSIEIFQQTSHNEIRLYYSNVNSITANVDNLCLSYTH